MRIDVGGYQLNYELAGAGPQTIAFAHGLGADLSTWRGQVERLSRRYRTLTWDMRGYGKSDAPAGDWTLADLSGDLWLLLDKLSIPATCVVGHSAGGVVAMHLAITHPEKVRALILVGTSSECNERAAQRYESLALKAEREGSAAALEELRGAVGGDGVPPDAVGFARAARCMGSLYREPLTPRLKAITCPTLLIVGDKDTIGPGGSVIIHRNVAGSRLEIVKDRGHSIYREDPAGFSLMVEEFLDSVAADAGRRS